MNVIVIAYHYPPDPAVGSVRPERMVKSLREAGHDVTVVAAAIEGDHAIEQPGVIRVRPWPGPRDLYRRMRGVLSRGRSSTIGADAYFEMSRYAPPEDTHPFKRFVSSLMWLPDDMHGFIPPAVRAARRVIRRTSASVVITTAPPFSVHVAGLVLRAVSNVRWIADYRDPWEGGTCKPAHVRSAFSEAVEARMEHACLRAAHGITAATNGIARLLRDRCQLAGIRPDGRIDVILNGFDPPAMADSAAMADSRRVVYLGYLYMHRDPRPFLDALADLASDQRIDMRDMTVDFYGAGRWLNNVSIEDHARAIGLGEHVRFFDAVGADEYSKVLASSTLLLLLAQKQPEQVPNKLYDYLAAGRPILAFVDADGESARMLEAIGGHFVITTDDPGPIRQTVLRALSGKAESCHDPAVLAEFTTSRQMERFVQLVEGIASPERVRPPREDAHANTPTVRTDTGI